MDGKYTPELTPGKEDKDFIEDVEFEWKHIKVDAVWHFVGRFGKYQVLHITLLLFQSVFVAIPILSSMFTGKAVDFQCVPDNAMGLSNETLMTTSCSVQVIDNMTSQVVAEETCTEYEYGDGSTTLSYIAQWDMVCDKKTLGQLPQILTMVGMAVGATTLPQLGDRFGRKKLVVGAYLGITTSSLVLAFVEHFELLIFFHFLGGACQQATLIPLFTMLIELMPMEMASFVSMMTALTWVGSIALVGLVGYIFREFNWRTLQLAFAVVTIPALFSTCFLDESVRWLLENSKMKDAKTIFCKACRMNKKDYDQLMKTVLNPKKDEVELLPPVDVPQDLADENGDHTTDRSYDLKAIFVRKHMRKITFVLCYTWFIITMTYYGLVLLSTSLAGDPYVNYFLSCIVEVPSGFFLYYTMQRFGRKRTLIYCNFISGAALLLTALVASLAPSVSAFIILQTCFTLIGKFFISSSFNIVWIYTPELYPTSLRNVGIGISSTFGRVGAVVSPLFTLLARLVLWAPGVLFSVGCFISVYLLTLIPETRWRELPKNSKEIDKWFEEDKKCSKKRKDKHLYEDTA